MQNNKACFFQCNGSALSDSKDECDLTSNDKLISILSTQDAILKTWRAWLHTDAKGSVQYIHFTVNKLWESKPAFVNCPGSSFKYQLC